jgi:hypothetical protein
MAGLHRNRVCEAELAGQVGMPRELAAQLLFAPGGHAQGERPRLSRLEPCAVRRILETEGRDEDELAEVK